MTGIRLFFFLWVFVGHGFLSKPRAEDWKSYYFPELSTRNEWDWGCQDWSIAGARYQNNVHIKSKKEKGFVKIQGLIKIPLEPGESFDEAKSDLLKLLSQAPEYKNWVLPGINENDLGEDYFLKVSDLLGETVNSRTNHHYLLGTYFFELMWIKKEGRSRVDYFVSKRTPPTCPEFQTLNGQDTELLFFRMTPRIHLLDMLVMELYFLPKTNSEDRELLMMASLRAKPASLVYQLLPEKMIARQMDQRIRRIFQNFVEFRRQNFLKRASSDRNSVPVLKPKSGP